MREAEIQMIKANEWLIVIRIHMSLSLHTNPSIPVRLILLSQPVTNIYNFVFNKSSTDCIERNASFYDRRKSFMSDVELS